MQTSKSKIFKSAINVLLILFLSSVVLSQITSEKEPVEKKQTDQFSETSEDLIHIGDLIDVDIVGSSEFDWRGGITPEGFLDGINFTEEPIYALCRTEKEIAADIAKGYEKTLRDPQVIVRIIDRSRRPVSLLYGAVRTPQRLQIRRQVRLNELLILAGGMTDKASGEIQILRSPNLSCAAKTDSEGGKTQTGKTIQAKQEINSQSINIKIGDLLKGKPESNPIILIGDIVTVLESKPIYVIGEVINPRPIEARSQINISRAITAAGGLTKDADPKKITIFRTENGETKSIEIDFEKVESGQAEDLELKAYDVVDVAQKGRKKNRYVPSATSEEENKINMQNLPLRIIE